MTRGNLARDIGHVAPFQPHSRLCFESMVENTFAAIFAASSRVAFSGIFSMTRAPHDSHSIVSLATLAQPLRAHGTGAIEGGLANHVPVLNVASLRWKSLRSPGRHSRATGAAFRAPDDSRPAVSPGSRSLLGERPVGTEVEEGAEGGAEALGWVRHLERATHL